MCVLATTFNEKSRMYISSKTLTCMYSYASFYGCFWTLCTKHSHWTKARGTKIWHWCGIPLIHGSPNHFKIDHGGEITTNCGLCSAGILWLQVPCILKERRERKSLEQELQCFDNLHQAPSNCRWQTCAGRQKKRKRRNPSCLSSLNTVG